MGGRPLPMPARGWVGTGEDRAGWGGPGAFCVEQPVLSGVFVCACVRGRHR